MGESFMEILDGNIRSSNSLEKEAWVLWRAAVHTYFTLRLNDDWTPKQIGFDFSMSGRSALYQLLNVFVTPVTAIMASLLYLKTRSAGVCAALSPG